MIIDKSKAYTTTDGRAVRIYATDGAAFEQVHGAINNGGVWYAAKWNAEGQYDLERAPKCDLTEADPHGILPRHRELLASALEGLSYYTDATAIREAQLNDLVPSAQAALIAIAELDAEKAK